MANKDLPNISIGDFAMDILNDMAKNPAKSLKPSLKESTIESSNAPDISHINVSDDFVSLVTENKKPKIKVIPNIIKEDSKEVKLENLVNKLSSLLVEARQLVEEISTGSTTVGNIGVNMASKKSKKDKPNPWAICHSSVGPKKSDKFERCVKKIKSKYGINK